MKALSNVFVNTMLAIMFILGFVAIEILASIIIWIASTFGVIILVALVLYMVRKVK